MLIIFIRKSKTLSSSLTKVELSHRSAPSSVSIAVVFSFSILFIRSLHDRIMGALHVIYLSIHQLAFLLLKNKQYGVKI